MSLDTKRSFPVGMIRRPKSGPLEPKKLQVKKRLLGKWHKHPVDKLVELAHFLETSNPIFAAKIWIRLLDSCELEENKKKTASPPLASEAEAGASIDAMKLLEEAEAHGESITPQSNTIGLGDGTAVIQIETGTEEDLQGDKG